MSSDSDAKPAETGSDKQQVVERSGATNAVTLVPQPQILSVAHGVAEEMVGLIQVSPEILNLASQRLGAAHMRELESRLGEQRSDLAEAATRERHLEKERTDLSVELARNRQALADEHGLRAP